MVSRIVDQVVGMRLEIQLVNSNTWLAYGDDQNDSETTKSPVQAFIHMVSKGSRELDAILFRSTCPYLYRIWAEPLFRSAQDESNQADSLFLTLLDDTVLGVVFTYLSEQDLARSVSLLCVRCRNSIVSRTHVDSLLGKALSTEMSELFLRSAQRRSKLSAQTLADRLTELSISMREARLAFESVGHEVLTIPEDQLSKLDKALCMVFQAVPDCDKRLLQLSIGLTARTVLQREKTLVDKILQAIRCITSESSQARRCLVHLLGSALAYGHCFGLKQPLQLSDYNQQDGELEASDAVLQGFPFTSLSELIEIKSRFQRTFTAEVAVVLHAQETQQEFQQLVASGALHDLADALYIICGETAPSVFQQLDSIRSSLHKIKKMASETYTAVTESPESFHFRLSHLYNLLDSSCTDVEERVAAVSNEIAALSNWLVPRRVNGLSYMNVHGTGGELKSLRDFVQQCRELLAVSSDSPASIRDLAVTVTALEASAIAQNASQRALFRQNSAPQREMSSAFVNAKKMVSRTLDPGDVVKQQREERMNEVMQQVLTDEDQASRKERLEAVLKLRQPSTLEETDEAITATSVETEDQEQIEEGQQKVLPTAMVEQIQSLRSSETADTTSQNEVGDAEASGTPEQPNVEDVEEEKQPEADSTSKSVSPTSKQTMDDHHSSSASADFKSAKLWKWSPCYVRNDEGGIWREIYSSSKSFLVPITGEEEKVLRKLFSRGPEVAFTVGTKHQKLKHFTSEDFSGLKSHACKRGSMESARLVDFERTKKAVQSLPQVKASTIARTATAPSSATLIDEVTLRDQSQVQETLQAMSTVVGESSLILPLNRIIELKRDGKLATVNLKPHCLEVYLSDDDFGQALKMSRAEFAKLPGWKRDKIKKDAGIF